MVMNDEERQVIDDIFRRLEQVAHQQRDPDAERYIVEKVRRQPYAPYAMAQAVFVQEQALANLNQEVEQLRAELDGARREARQGGGGLLSSIFGGGRATEPPRHAQQGSPWGRPGPQPMQGGGYGMPQQGPMGGPQFGAPGPWGGAMPSRGGGFLQSAMATAAGVAGGVMIANALSHAFGGDHSGAGAGQNLAGLGEADQGGAGNEGITDSLYHDASANDQDFGGDDFGGGGDGGDWA
jgi:hypothetical protein